MKGNCHQNCECNSCKSQSQKVQNCDTPQPISWNDLVYIPNFLASSNIYQTVKVELASVDVLGLNTPKLILPTTDSGLMYDVNAVVLKSSAGTPYTFTGTLRLNNGGTDLFSKTAGILTNASQASQMLKLDNDNNIVPGNGIFLVSNGGTPTVGNLTLTVYITYRLIVL